MEAPQIPIDKPFEADEFGPFETEDLTEFVGPDSKPFVGEEVTEFPTEIQDAS